jgi:3-oxoacyl-[acyl-carrier-protein] synthase II
MKKAVITGMGVVSPNGIGRRAFAEAVLGGRSGVSRISLFDATAMRVQIAGEVKDFPELDWVPASERKHVSRAVPLALAASSEALADAGVDAAAMSMAEKREVGIMLGSGGGAQDFSEEQYRLWHTGNLKQVSIFTVPSGTMGTISSEISMRFGFRGLSHVITTGCTSSTDALGYAAEHIQLGRLPVILAGGVDSPITPGVMLAFAMMRVVTPSWNHDPMRGSRPFTANRDGFVLSEGAWMFVLEDYDRARARGAHIYAEVAGYGSSCEAFHRVRLEECGEEPARAVQLAMDAAGVRPSDVGYVNLHGTSTELNDRIETRAMKLAFGEERARRIPMSSLKSQIGHPQGASGAAGVAATLVAMQCGKLPPTINLDLPDPECDLDYIPEPGRAAQIDVAVCNCIAFGSKNSALVLRAERRI